MTFAILASSSFNTVASRNLYWVGGSDSWDGTAASKWALSSGGTGGEAIPTAIDNVFFDGNSGAVTVTIATITANCKTLDFTGFTGTFAGSTASNLRGSLSLAAGMTRSYTGAITFSSTVSGKTLTFNGITIASALTFNGIGGVWTWQDAMNSSSSAFTLTNGAINFNGKAQNVGAINISNSNVRGLTTGAATITCTSFTATTITNLTYDFTGSSLTVTGSVSFAGGGLNFGNVTITSNADIGVTGANSYVNFTRNNSSGYVNINYSGAQTVSGLYTATGSNDSNARILVKSLSFNAVQSLILNGTTSLTNVDFADIAVTGSAAPISGTSVGDCGGNTGIIFAALRNLYWVHPATASQAIFTNPNFSTTTGGSTGAPFPLCQDTMVFDANSFPAMGKTVTIGATLGRMGNMDWSAATNSPTLNFDTTTEFYGTFITLTAGMTVSGTQNMTIKSRAACVFTSATRILTNALFTINAPGGGLTLGDTFTHSGTTGFVLTLGSFIDSGFAFKTVSFISNGTATRSVTKTGNWELTGVNNVLNLGTGAGLTWGDAAGVIKLTNNSSTVKTFVGAGKTFNNFWNATLGTGACVVTGNNIFNDFKVDPGRTQQFVGGATQTCNTLTINGTLGNLVTLSRSSGSGQYNISVAVDPSPLTFLSISNANFTTPVTALASTCVDGGGNTGITFV